MLWCGYQLKNLRFLQHLLAAAVHLSSALFILLYGLHEAGWDVSAYRVHVRPGNKRAVWYYKCYDRTTRSYIADVTSPAALDCPDDNKSFYSPGLRDKGRTINLLLAAFFFAAWSGLCHLVAALYVRKVQRSKDCTDTDAVWGQRIIRWVDYSVSAPLMLAVVGASFSAANSNAVIFAPLVLALLLWLAASIEPAAVSPGYSDSIVARSVVLVILLILYAFTWGPVYSAVDRATEPPPLNTNIGKAPSFIQTMVILVAYVFSLFPAVYIYDFFRARPDHPPSETAYIALSMAAKVSLHAFLAIAVVSQAAVLSGSEGETSGPPPDMDNNSMKAVAASVGALAGAILLVFVVAPLTALAIWGAESVDQKKAPPGAFRLKMVAAARGHNTSIAKVSGHYLLPRGKASFHISPGSPAGYLDQNSKVRYYKG